MSNVNESNLIAKIQINASMNQTFIAVLLAMRHEEKQKYFACKVDVM